MPDLTCLEIATKGRLPVPTYWMPTSPVAPFILEDPAIVWLEYHGAAHGFEPVSLPYEFGDFIAEKARQFEEQWLAGVRGRGSDEYGGDEASPEVPGSGLQGAVAGPAVAARWVPGRENRPLTKGRRTGVAPIAGRRSEQV